MVNSSQGKKVSRPGGCGTSNINRLVRMWRLGRETCDRHPRTEFMADIIPFCRWLGWKGFLLIYIKEMFTPRGKFHNYAKLTIKLEDGWVPGRARKEKSCRLCPLKAAKVRFLGQSLGPGRPLAYWMFSHVDIFWVIPLISTVVELIWSFLTIPTKLPSQPNRQDFANWCNGFIGRHKPRCLQYRCSLNPLMQAACDSALP